MIFSGDGILDGFCLLDGIAVVATITFVPWQVLTLAQWFLPFPLLIRLVAPKVPPLPGSLPCLPKSKLGVPCVNICNCLFTCVTGKQSQIIHSSPLSSAPSKSRGSLPGLGLP